MKSACSVRVFGVSLGVAPQLVHTRVHNWGIRPDGGLLAEQAAPPSTSKVGHALVDLGAAHVGTLQGEPHERLLEGSRAIRVLQMGEVPVGALDPDHGDGVPEQAPRLLLAGRMCAATQSHM